jgi:hypothetical protein
MKWPEAWGQCYDFENSFAEKRRKMATLLQTAASSWQQIISCIDFQETKRQANFFAENW